MKELRKVNNYTQDYVAAVLGIVRQTYSHYETGRRTPDAEALYKLAGLYNISIDDLMHLTVDIDREVSYDAPVPSQSSEDLSEFLEFFNDPANKKSTCFIRIWKKNCFFILIRYPKRIRKKLLNLQKLRPASLYNRKLLLQILFLMVSKEAIFNTMEITISLHALYSGFRKPLVFFPQACVSPSSDVHSQCISGGNPRPRAKSPIHGCHTDVAF